MNFEATVVDGLKAVLESPQGQADALAAITTVETDLTALVTNGVKNVKNPGGLAGAALTALEGPVVGVIVAQIQSDPQKLLAALDADVDAWAKSLGG